MSEGILIEVAPKQIYKTPEKILARKRRYRQKNAKKLRANNRTRYYADLENARAKGRVAGRRFLDQCRVRNSVSPDELELYRVDPLREERLKQTNFVVCRECGERKLALHHHLSKRHELALENYLEKWGVPPHIALISQEKRRRGMKAWVSLHKREHFGGKRYKPKLGEASASRRGKPSTPAMRRGAMRVGLQLSGRSRPDRLGKKRLNGVWVQTDPVDDARIAELRLAGRSTKEIAAAVGLTGSGVYYRLTQLGFPSGEACRFLHGNPVSKKHFTDLCDDFGTTMREVVRSLRENPEYEVARESATYFGGKAHHANGQISRTYYNSLSNSLSRRHVEDILGLRFANLVLDTRRRWTESFCFEYHTGKKVRHFLKSELRDLPELRTRVRDGLNGLRAWMRSNSAAQPMNALNWICAQAREKVAGRHGPAASLLFLWPSLKALNQNKPSLLAGRRFIDEAVDEVLSLEYDAAPSRIAVAAQGKLAALDSRMLGRSVAGGNDVQIKLQADQLAKLKAELAEAKRDREPKRRGRRPAPKEQSEYFIVGQQVEIEIPESQKKDKDAIIRARRIVSERTGRFVDTVAQYHKKYRQVMRAMGRSLPSRPVQNLPHF